MIKYISSWAQQIIIAVIFVAILEIILPKRKQQKIHKNNPRSIHIVHNSITSNNHDNRKRLENRLFKI